MNPSYTRGLLGLIPMGTRITGAFSLRNGKCKRVSFCPCGEPATHLVAARGYRDEYKSTCLGCLARFLARGLYPNGVKIRKRV